MILVYEYTHEEFKSKVNDFGDDYHLPDPEVKSEEKEMMYQLRKMKRKYRNFGDWCEAKALYINYTKGLIEKYGGKKRFKFLYTIGRVPDYIPYCPSLKFVKANKKYYEGGLPAEEPALELKTPQYETDIRIPKNISADIVVMKKLKVRDPFGKDRIRESINEELRIIGEYYKGRVKHPTRLSKKAQKRRIMARAYTTDTKYIPIEKRYKEYKKRLWAYDYEEDKIDPDAYIYYKDSLLSKQDAEEIELYDALKERGIMVEKKTLSKGSQKVIRNKKFKTKKKKKGKKKNTKYVDSFTNGRYSSFDEFEREMLAMTSRELNK